MHIAHSVVTACVARAVVPGGAAPLPEHANSARRHETRPARRPRDDRETSREATSTHSGMPRAPHSLCLRLLCVGERLLMHNL